MVLSCVVCLAPVIATYKPEFMLQWFLSGFIVTCSVITAPYWMKLKFFRGYFYWPDAMSERQKRLLANGQLKLAQQTSYNEGFSSKLKPYVMKMSTLVFVVMLLDYVLSLEPIVGTISILLGFAVMAHCIVLVIFFVPNPITKWPQ